MELRVTEQIRQCNDVEVHGALKKRCLQLSGPPYHSCTEHVRLLQMLQAIKKQMTQFEHKTTLTESK